MAMELERECPACEAVRTFRRAAGMELHLGKKAKWRCPECDYQFVTVDGVVDTGSA